VTAPLICAKDILERLEEISVLVLAASVLTSVAGLSVNLSGIGLSGLIDLGLIMVVPRSTAGKVSAGAFAGGPAGGRVRPRHAGVLAALMNNPGPDRDRDLSRSGFSCTFSAS